MYRKFACIDFIPDDISPSRLRVGEGGSSALILSDMELLGLRGYHVTLPITLAEAAANTFNAQRLVDRTIRTLQIYDVDVFAGAGLKTNQPVFLANGVGLLPFFMPQALKTALRALGKRPYECEVVITAGDECAVSCLLSTLCSEINQLTILTDRFNKTHYEVLADNIYAEYGLHTEIEGFDAMGAKKLARADIVINTGAYGRYELYLKRKCLFFDLSRRPESLNQLSNARPDCICLDNIKVRYGETTMPLYLFEIAFVMKCGAYQDMLSEGYSDARASEIALMLERMNVKVTGFFSASKPISMKHIRTFY